VSLSQFEEAVGHWRASSGSPSEAGHHGGETVAPVEAIFELGQVARDLADGPVGGGDGGLDVAERVLACVSTALQPDPVWIG